MVVEFAGTGRDGTGGSQTCEKRGTSRKVERCVNDRFDFKINGVSHVYWFRKKMNEFRELVGMPKPRQNKGVKLLIKIKSMIVEWYITIFCTFVSE